MTDRSRPQPCPDPDQLDLFDELILGPPDFDPIPLCLTEERTVRVSTPWFSVEVIFRDGPAPWTSRLRSHGGGK